MEHEVNPFHSVLQSALVAHITDIELDLTSHLWHTRLEVMTHIILLLLITREDTDLSDVSTEETVQHCVSKRTSTTCYQQGLICKRIHKYKMIF